MKGTFARPVRKRTPRGAAIIYRRCGGCGAEYDERMMKPFKAGHVCVLCLHLARERKQRDSRAGG